MVSILTIPSQINRCGAFSYIKVLLANYLVINGGPHLGVPSSIKEKIRELIKEDADALYAFKSRGFGGEIGLVTVNTPLPP